MEFYILSLLVAHSTKLEAQNVPTDAEGPEDYWRFSDLQSKLEDQRSCVLLSKKKKIALLGWKRLSWI